MRALKSLQFIFSSSRKSDKCLENHYLDFLVYLAGFEASGLKIYNLFESLDNRELHLGECYSVLASSYLVLERSLGDPHIALRKLAEFVKYSDLSSFLRGYSSVLVTSGDTRIYVESALKQELAKYKTKINETLRLLETLYEALLVAVFGVLFIAALPIGAYTQVVGGLLIYFIGFVGYFFSLEIVKKLYYAISTTTILLDALFFVASLFSIINYYASIVSIAMLVIFHIHASKAYRLARLLEEESTRILYETYSRVLMGDSYSSAFIGSLESTNLVEYRLVWFSLLQGAVPEGVLKAAIKGLAERIFTSALSTLNCSSIGNSYVAHIVSYVDEVRAIRKQVRERARYFLVYSALVMLIAAISYYMMYQTPVIPQLSKHVIASYGYAGTIVASIPAVVTRDQGFVTSKTSIVLAIMALILQHMLLL